MDTGDRRHQKPSLFWKAFAGGGRWVNSIQDEESVAQRKIKTGLSITFTCFWERSDAGMTDMLPGTQHVSPNIVDD